MAQFINKTAEQAAAEKQIRREQMVIAIERQNKRAAGSPNP